MEFEKVKFGDLAPGDRIRAKFGFDIRFQENSEGFGEPIRRSSNRIAEVVGVDTNGKALELNTDGFRETVQIENPDQTFWRLKK